MIETLFSQINHWHWWILAAVLLGLDLSAPGMIFLWIALAAAATGIVALLAPGLGWPLQFLLFAVLGLVSAAVGRRVFGRPQQSDHPTLNRRGAQYVGRTFTLAEPITDGIGRIRVDDTTWKISGPDQPTGRRVRVTGADGMILMVESVGSVEDGPSPRSGDQGE
ncbi:MAG: NfeD family protein [Alphaproteobacteria bacterium]